MGETKIVYVDYSFNAIPEYGDARGTQRYGHSLWADNLVISN
jgi:hypothetical protein